MTREELLAAAVKLVAAFPVLRWPLAGALISIAADAFDVIVMNYVDLGGGGVRDYHAFDKWTDLPALITFFVSSLRWSGRDRRVSEILFFTRLAGVASFEAFHWRPALVVGANFFEVWFLYLCMRDRWLAGSDLRRRLRAPTLTVFIAIKAVQEYLLHIVGLLDRYALKDVLTQVLAAFRR